MLLYWDIVSRINYTCIFTNSELLLVPTNVHLLLVIVCIPSREIHRSTVSFMRTCLPNCHLNGSQKGQRPWKKPWLLFSKIQKTSCVHKMSIGHIIGICAMICSRNLGIGSLSHMRATKAQIKLCMHACAVWSEPSLLAYRVNTHCRINERT